MHDNCITTVEAPKRLMQGSAKKLTQTFNKIENWKFVIFKTYKNIYLLRGLV
jgi:hypothetical protein